MIQRSHTNTTQEQAVAAQLKASSRILQDNRTHSPVASRLSGVVQRVPIGTGAGTDDDRNNFVTEALGPGEQMDVRGDHNGRARVTNFIVNGVNQVNKKVKHYAVIKSGTRYQFPVKHVFGPRWNNLFHHYTPNYRHGGAQPDAHRGGAAEAFGGNQDLAHNHVLAGANVANSRDQTLAHEYQEENHAHGGANLAVERSVKFANVAGPANMTGTLSIARTDQALVAGHNAHGLGGVASRGEAEMAGTVVIETNDLINGHLLQDALEAQIGNRIHARINAMYLANHNHDPNGLRVLNSFASQGGILAHMVGMVAEDILAERLRRHAAAVAVIVEAIQAFQQRRAAATVIANAFRGHQARQQLARLRQRRDAATVIANAVRGHQARQQLARLRAARAAQQARQRRVMLTALLIALGLIYFLPMIMHFISTLMGGGNSGGGNSGGHSGGSNHTHEDL